MWRQFHLRIEKEKGIHIVDAVEVDDDEDLCFVHKGQKGKEHNNNNEPRWASDRRISSEKIVLSILHARTPRPSSFIIMAFVNMPIVASTCRWRSASSSLCGNGSLRTHTSRGVVNIWERVGRCWREGGTKIM